MPVAGGCISAYISQTGGLGNVGAVSYYWTRAVILGNWRYRYARYLGFGSYSVHAGFGNVVRSEGRSIRCIKN
ncbi:hypothetical protein BSPLISOX_1065 [uncultured Gammaproteobacteria bacterium]|nr:hypothetical protein [uncultured Gammaproteobacteria bacterium]VVH66548.1 hypothetical protein BSPLISOX_1065 [uncultured Gammaproteobacteria bacterium]